MQDPSLVKPEEETNVNKHWTIAGRGSYPTALTTIVISSRWYTPENTNSCKEHNTKDQEPKEEVCKARGEQVRPWAKGGVHIDTNLKRMNRSA